MLDVLGVGITNEASITDRVRLTTLSASDSKSSDRKPPKMSQKYPDI